MQLNAQGEKHLTTTDFIQAAKVRYYDREAEFIASVEALMARKTAFQKQCQLDEAALDAEAEALAGEWEAWSRECKAEIVALMRMGGDDGDA